MQASFPLFKNCFNPRCKLCLSLFSLNLKFFSAKVKIFFLVRLIFSRSHLLSVSSSYWTTKQRNKCADRKIRSTPFRLTFKWKERRPSFYSPVLKAHITKLNFHTRYSVFPPYQPIISYHFITYVTKCMLTVIWRILFVTLYNKILKRLVCSLIAVHIWRHIYKSKVMLWIREWLSK